MTPLGSIGRGRGWLLAAAGALVALALFAGGSSRSRAGGSSFSRASSGLMGARLYLAARGTPVEILQTTPDRWSEEVEGGTLVIAFPWQQAWPGGLRDALEQHLAAGGEVLVAYTGSREAHDEEVFLSVLGVRFEDLRPAPSLRPDRWLRHVRQVWKLEPVGGGAAAVEVRAFDRGPEADEEVAFGWGYLDAEGRALIGRREPKQVSQGSITLVPLDALSNGRLGRPGNGELLEALRRHLPAPWWFDEHHHGLPAPSDAARKASAQVLDLATIHLLVLYLLTLVAVARPFGPRWREVRQPGGSTAAFFLGLGGLHHRLGHHREGAQRLLARSEELYGEQELPADLRRQVHEGLGPRGFLALARRLAVAPALRRRSRPAWDDSTTATSRPGAKAGASMGRTRRPKW